MVIARRNVADVAACLAIAAFGAAVVVLGINYRVGTLTRMGPGFFPILTGSLVVALAIAAAVEAAFASPVRPVIKLRPVLFVSLSIVVWAMLVESTGIIPSTIALVAISSMARSPFRPVSLIVLSIGLCLAGYFVFIGLGMPLTMLGR